MTQDELKIWLLDTISEGEYSFKELADYVGSHGIDTYDLSRALMAIFDDNLTMIELRPTDGKNKFLDNVEGRKSIENISSIISEESSSRSAHYLQITPEGRALLDDMGIN